MIKKIKIKNFFFLLVFVFLFLGVANLVFAAEVKDGPCANSANLGACVVTFFKWGIDAAAVIAALSFTLGAVTLMVAGDDGSKITSAKDRMKGSIFGLILLGASYIIMNSINPALVSPTISQLAQTNLTSPPTPPGVYFYADSGCSKDVISQTTSSLDGVPTNTQGIKIVDDTTSGAAYPMKYGYILHKVVGLKFGGSCGQPVTDAGCKPVNSMTGAIDVFSINPKPESSGDGVTFYSRPYGLDKGARGGFFPLASADIQSPSTKKTPGSMSFKWDNVDVTDEYKTLCPSFDKCPGSIDIKGSYIVAVYSSGSSGSSGSYCQTFSQNVQNLNAEPVVAAGTDTIDNIYIIPTGFGFSGGGGSASPTAGASGSW